ncbi:DUF3144 domain-containing protein [Aurantimonas marina]|uniref:DUF3144 domain-containing protein n=1 Tax=Aurantimonas marina TaxID=2780508 RepID=UPI0019D1135D|nr:DUF3144 domain-containing protein [Aurantimonas marina]
MPPQGNGTQGQAAEPLEKTSPEAFVRLADRFIDVANRANRKVPATDIHMAFLYAAARYNAHVGRNVRDVDDHEVYVEEMAGIYKEMLRTHLSDPDV